MIVIDLQFCFLGLFCVIFIPLNLLGLCFIFLSVSNIWLKASDILRQFKKFEVSHGYSEAQMILASLKMENLYICAYYYLIFQAKDYE